MNFKPGLLTRLSNIIVIQVFFIFTALAIIFYFPSDENQLEMEYRSLKDKFTRLGDQLEPILRDVSKESGYSEQADQIRNEFMKTLDIKKIAQSYLFIKDGNRGVKKIFTLKDDTFGGGKSEIMETFYKLVDNTVIDNGIIISDELSIPTIKDMRHFAFYYHFKINDNLSAVLVSIIDHNLIVSSRPHMMYTMLILFLASTLVSLLTIYLLHSRFQEPLKRLIKGFEKTTEGELFYLVDADGDSELTLLATAFNKMSKTLWQNHKELNNYNACLKETNLLLTESQEFLETLTDSSPSCIIATFAGGGITVFNRKASEVFGFDHDDAIGKNINELFTHSFEEIKPHRKQGEKVQSFEILCRRNDGSLFPAYVIFSPIRYQNKKVSANLYIIKDISESKSFQEMMIRLDRYYTRGEMVGDIAHEINNFLAILSGNIELVPLYVKRGDHEQLRKKLEVMKSTVDKISRFTDGLMDVEEGDLRFNKVDINQLIETVLAFLKPQNKYDDIEVITNLSTDIPLVELDSGQIQQLIVNLVNNASESLAEKEGDRKIVISTQLVASSGGYAIEIKVRDNGPGVPPDKEELLFKKRFTGKRKGHGIGLMTCKRIVDAHKGSIAYKYQNGAAFCFKLPVNIELELLDTANLDTSKVPI